MRGQETNKLEGLKLKAGLGESFGVIHSNCEAHNTGEKDFVNKYFSSLPPSILIAGSVKSYQPSELKDSKRGNIRKNKHVNKLE